MHEDLIRRYYAWGTPVFWLIDVIWDAPMRVSFIPNQHVRYAYYAACVGCALWMKKQPRLTRRIGMSESAVNFTLVILSIWVPTMDAMFGIAEMPVGFGPPPLDPMQPINAGLSGASALASFYSRHRT